MKTLIPILNISCYEIMLVLTLAYGSFAIARHIHLRVLKRFCSFMTSNMLVKSGIALFCFLIIDFSQLFSQTWIVQLLGLGLGLVLGFFVFHVEKIIVRQINRGMQQNKKSQSHILRNAILIKNNSMQPTSKTINKGLSHIRQGYQRYINKPEYDEFTLMPLLGLAIVEEVLFRGAPYLLSIYFGGYLGMLIITFSCVFFVASHWVDREYHFLTMLPLTFMTTVSLIVSQSLIVPFAVHVTFNLLVYQNSQRYSSARIEL